MMADLSLVKLETVIGNAIKRGDSSLQEYYTLPLDKYFLMFQRIIVPSSSF